MLPVLLLLLLLLLMLLLLLLLGLLFFPLRRRGRDPGAEDGGCGGYTNSEGGRVWECRADRQRC